ncbi:MAG: SpoIIE family protein phosphatase [Flavobacteriales bacterium]|jgi:serine phosphatase RsbU (regulator of sigma subunit)|nr:SpoIIE family protein phosphatase [Flavobacteriales bacterium]
MKLIFLITITLFFGINNFSYAQYSNLDSLRIELEKADTDSAALQNLYWINRYYREHDSIDEALSISYEMLKLAEQSKDQKKITWSKRVVAHNMNLQGSKEEALQYILDYINSLSSDDTADIALLYQDIGHRYTREENFSEALKYYFKSAHYYNLLGDDLWITKNIATTYSELNDEKNASKYNLIYIEKAKADSNYHALANGYLAEGYYHLMLINHETSYKYSQKAKDVYLNILKDPENRGLGVVYGNIADVYIYYYKNAPDSIKIVNPLFNGVKDIKKAMLDTAEYYIDKSYAIASKNNKNLFYIFYGYGDLYYYQGKVKRSEKEFLKCYRISKENEGMTFDRKKVSEQLYKVYKKLGDEKKALKFYEEFVALRDTLFNQDKQRDVGKQEAKFEYEKQKAQEEAQRAKQKAIEDARAEQERAVAKEKEKNQQIITYSIALGLILISIFSALIYRRLKIARAQQIVIEKQKKTIEKNRNEMLESIEYSKNIQQRIFPTIEEIQALLPNSFVYFRPKDVVSGDFYWAHQKGDKTFFSVADCTGHGVPGAFMTLISLNLINAIILEDGVDSTATILERLHIRLKERLSVSEEDQVKHGLDIAMCAYNHKTKELEYSGLHNPLYIINSDNELREIKGDNLFLGISNNFQVTSHKIEIQSGDSVYMSTDGFPDQKGGEKGKKYYYSRLRNSLRVVDAMPVDNRRGVLNQKFEDWKGDKEQIDDVCIMGISFE